MTGGRRGAAWPALPPGPGEPTLDQLLADPIVQQLMRRDGIDESATRRFLRQAALARAAQNPGGMLPGSCARDDPITILLAAARSRSAVAEALRQRNSCPDSRHDPSSDARCSSTSRITKGSIRGPSPEPSISSPTRFLRLLDRLEGVGLIARMPDPQDPEAYVLALTAGALPMIERIYELTRNVYDEAQLGAPGSPAVPAPMSERVVCKIIDWLSGDECHELDLAGLTAGFGVRMRAAGIPLDRMALHLRTLHPLIRGRTFAWAPDEPVEFLDLQHGTNASAALRNPLYHVATAREWLSLRLDDPAAKWSDA